MRTCTIEGCDGPHRAKGYCAAHYNTLLHPDRHRTEIVCAECGSTYVTTRTNGRYCSVACAGIARSREAAARRLTQPPRARVTVSPPRDRRGPLRRAVEDGDPAGVLAALEARTIATDSGCWQWQGAVKEGYPVVQVDGRYHYAHRLSLEAATLAPLGAQPAHHKCANTRCINPEHLQPVTHRENVAEMLARNYMVQRIADLEAALARVAPTHPLLREIGLPTVA